MKFSLKRKTALFVLIIAFVIAAVTAGVSYRTYAGAMDTRFKDSALDIARTAAALSDADAVARYADAVLEIYRQDPAPQWADQSEEQAYYARYDGIADEAYRQLYDRLQSVKANNRDVLYLYLFTLDEASHTGIYLLDVDDSDSACPMGTWDVIYPENYGVFDDPALGFPAYISQSEFGWLCSAGAPITQADGTVVGYAMVDISMDAVMADRAAFLRSLVVAVLVVTLLLTALFIAVIRRTVVQPINRLASATAHFVAERDQGHTAITQLNIHTGDEIEHLAASVQQMELDLNTYIANLRRVTQEKERIGAELSVATQIQADMLPSIFPPFPSHPEFDIYASMTPAKEVGGDFYDFFLVDEDHLCLVMADVSGKGVPAALFMVIAKTLLKNSALTGQSPRQILETVNNQLCEGNRAEMFVTAWLGILQLSTGRLVAANAGHEYPVCQRAGGPFALVKDRHGFVLAGMENTRYREYTLDLAPGDRLFLYTDGVPEATDSHQQLYGTQRMLDALNRCGDAAPRQLLEAVQADIRTFVGQADQFDDITMLALEMKEMAHHYRLELAPTLEELPRATAFVEESFRQEGLAPAQVYKLNVAVDEIFSNIARYSGATRAAVVCFVQDGKATLRFEDDGAPFDPLAAADPDTTLSAQDRQIGGLGVFLVKRTMDGMRYERRQEKNCLTLELCLPAGPRP